MVFGKIVDGICVNILLFDSEEIAKEFDKELVLLEEGFGIGDWYKDNEWSHPIKSKEERMVEIIKELEELDKTVDRQWEDYYIRENVTPVERISIIIEQKEILRAEYQTLNEELKEVDINAEENN